MPTQALQVLMIAAGIAAAFIGLLVARRGRTGGRVSVPTSVVIGLCLALGGYHLIVWSFPQTLTPLQLNRQFWWVGLAGLLAACVLSLVLDRLRGADAAKGGESAPRDGSGPIR